MKPSIKYIFVLKPKSLKGSFVPKGIPIGFQMAEKNANKHTTQTHIFVFILVEIINLVTDRRCLNIHRISKLLLRNYI